MSKIVVPQGMRVAAAKAVHEQCGRVDYHPQIRVALEAAVLWLSENPIVPTLEQNRSLRDEWDKGAFAERNIDYLNFIAREWQRHMFYEREPKIPEEIRDLQVNDLDMGWDGPINKRILEAFRRGQKTVKCEADYKSILKDWIKFCEEAEPVVNSCIMISAIHGFPYDGPTWEELLARTRAAVKEIDDGHSDGFGRSS